MEVGVMKIKLNLQQKWFEVDIKDFNQFIMQLRKEGKIEFYKSNIKTKELIDFFGKYTINYEINYKHKIYIYDMNLKEEIEVQDTIEKANNMMKTIDKNKINKLAVKFF